VSLVYPKDGARWISVNALFLSVGVIVGVALEKLPEQIIFGVCVDDGVGLHNVLPHLFKVKLW
jgi:hypothetical protein